MLSFVLVREVERGFQVRNIQVHGLVPKEHEPTGKTRLGVFTRDKYPGKPEFELREEMMSSPGSQSPPTLLQTLPPPPLPSSFSSSPVSICTG